MQCRLLFRSRIRQNSRADVPRQKSHNSCDKTSMITQRLSIEFFDRHHVTVAQDMIGTSLHWDGVAGIIVETEAYAAVDDPACHVSFRPSAREFFNQQSPGTVYAYISYGIHWMLNVLTRDGIVLIRAIEPAGGLQSIQSRRRTESFTALCSGPGKLGQALALQREDHGSSLLTRRRHLRPRPEDFDASTIAADVRVGLSVALDREWRFLLPGSKHVSVPHGKAITKSRTRSK